MLFLPDLHLFILHYYKESSTSSDGVYSTASLGLWTGGYTSDTFLSHLELCYKLNSHKFFKHFYVMILIDFIDGAFLILFPPQTPIPTHFVNPMFSGSHRYKPQAQEPSMDECTRAYFFTVPFWMEANHSLCNSVKILPAPFSSSYSVVWNFKHAVVGRVFWHLGRQSSGLCSIQMQLTQLICYYECSVHWQIG